MVTVTHEKHLYTFLYGRRPDRFAFEYVLYLPIVFFFYILFERVWIRRH